LKNPACVRLHDLNVSLLDSELSQQRQRILGFAAPRTSTALGLGSMMEILRKIFIWFPGGFD
jgi:hypothetical protein